MKEFNSKTKMTFSNFLQSIFINNTDIFQKKERHVNFMNFSRDKVQNLGKDILDLFAVFESYDNQVIMSTTSSTR